MTGVFYVPLSIMGMERTPNKSQHTKSTLEKKILPTLLPGFELATSRSRVRCSYQQAVSPEYPVLLVIALDYIKLTMPG